MEVNFIGQGLNNYNSQQVGRLIKDSLESDKYNSFICFTAFASRGAVCGINNVIKNNSGKIKNLKIFVGIDQKATSKEALEELMAIEYGKKYIYYTLSPIIYHPKIYILEGDKDNKIILGSSNLTVPGLGNNIESSLVLDFNNEDKDGLKVKEQIYEYYESFINETNPNLHIITEELIEDLYSSGKVLQESRAKTVYGKGEKDIISSVNGKIKKLFPKIEIQIPEIKSNKKNSSKRKNSSISNLNTDLNLTNDDEFKLVWSKKLSATDAQHPPNPHSKPTGNIKLSQAKYKHKGKLIDVSRYFREYIFANLNWIEDEKIINVSRKIKSLENGDTFRQTIEEKNKLQRSEVEIECIINGESLGQYKFEISHDLGRIANQGNVPTWLHWNTEIVKKLKDNDCTGKIINLYKTSKNKFRIIIE